MLVDVRSPRSSDAPPGAPPWWDRALAIVLALAVVAEVLLRAPSVTASQVAICIVGAAALWIRRPQPRAATMLAFGTATVGTLIDLFRGAPPGTLYTGAALLLLPYSLSRWGSRRDIAYSAPFVAAAFSAAALHGEMKTAIDAIGAAIVLLFPAALGASVRFRAIAQDRALEQARLREREQLARELHDSVAHHVTAIAIQAQAGRAVLASRPELALQTLEAIELEAAHTLGELRAMVGALRDDRAAAREPGRVADILQLAAPRATPVVDVDLRGELDGLEPALEAALFRMAQESITNAMRHARQATRVRVHVDGDAEQVRLSVRDDGQAAVWPRAASGYGLVGMAERAALLGGTFRAGPTPDGGWRVEAVLPRSRAA
jgi:signal transduction histidine kinase